MCWIDNACFAEHSTQRLGRNFFTCCFKSNWNLCHSDGLLFMSFLRCSFRIIFTLVRYLATIAMKAFYNEALRIAFKHCYDFQLVLIDWATVFMQIVHRASRSHGMAYFIIVAFSWFYCVLWSPVRSCLQVFLSLYRVNREISKVFCGSETGFLAWKTISHCHSSHVRTVVTVPLRLVFRSLRLAKE